MGIFESVCMSVFMRFVPARLTRSRVLPMEKGLCGQASSGCSRPFSCSRAIIVISACRSLIFFLLLLLLLLEKRTRKNMTSYSDVRLPRPAKVSFPTEVNPASLSDLRISLKITRLPPLRIQEREREKKKARTDGRTDGLTGWLMTLPLSFFLSLSTYRVSRLLR